MAAILRVRDENGNVISIPAIKGDKGDKGDTGDKGDVGEQIQSDWAQNEETAKDYVKNRTHYDSRKKAYGKIEFTKTFDTPCDNEFVKIADTPIDLESLKGLKLSVIVNEEGDIYEVSMSFPEPSEILYVSHTDVDYMAVIIYADDNNSLEVLYASSPVIILVNDLEQQFGLSTPGLYIPSKGVQYISFCIDTEPVIGELKKLPTKFIDDMYYKELVRVEKQGDISILTNSGEISTFPSELGKQVFTKAEEKDVQNAVGFFVINGVRYDNAVFVTAEEAGEKGYQFKYVVGNYEFRTISANAGTYKILPEGTDFQLWAEGKRYQYHPVPNTYLPVWERLEDIKFEGGQNNFSLLLKPYYEKYRELFLVVPLCSTVSNTTSRTRIQGQYETMTTYTISKCSLYNVVFHARRIGFDNQWIITAQRTALDNYIKSSSASGSIEAAGVVFDIASKIYASTNDNGYWNSDDPTKQATINIWGLRG